MINVISPSSRSLWFSSFFKFLSKAGSERIYFSHLYLCVWIDSRSLFISTSYATYFLLRSEYYLAFILHKHSRCLYISINCERNSLGMIRKSHMIQAKQTEHWEQVERAAHTFQLALRLACARSEKSSAADLLHAMPKTAQARQVSRLLAHTLRLSLRRKSVHANRTAKRSVCGGPSGKSQFGSIERASSCLLK
jgi:hypothetical protein